MLTVGSCDESRSWRIVSETELSADVRGFWEAIDVWTDKVHVVNRRLCAVCPRYSFVIAGLSDEISTWRAAKLVADAHRGRKAPVEIPHVEGWRIGDENDEFDLRIQVRDLLPKRPDKYKTQTEIAIFDKRYSTAVYLPVNESESGATLQQQQHCHCDFKHAFRFNPVDCRLELLAELEASNTEWMACRVLPKLAKWALETVASDGVSAAPRTSSLSIVSAPRYFQRYRELKERYAASFVQMWPEKTDPAKFVHEDVAIAAYLLVLWEDERKDTRCGAQSFADLGCGNGLLTHILCSEGHPGVGFDVKRRKIWDMYGPGTTLKESAVVPTAKCPVPECDWLIGNHSDELTPWIPVMAARSANARFFVLPCCPYDFDRKFQRRDSAKSQYRSYLDYVRQVGEVCGFAVAEDRLRIPSTKRICLIGQRRSSWPQERSAIEERIDAFITERRRWCGVVEESANETWFKARPADEPTRNCTRLDKSLKESIIATVMDVMLSSDDTSINVVTDGGEKRWRTGGLIPFDKMVEAIDPSELAQLKKECGGLKTLLKNHYHIFEVCREHARMRNYHVGVPHPRRTNKKSAPSSGKTKLCWFFANYPDGCPVLKDLCAFAHGEADLRARDTK